MEDYKDINGFEGMYQISNLGNVKSLSRRVLSRYSNDRIINEKLLSLNKDKATGYVSITLSLGKKRITKSVHRLVASAFIDNPLNKPEVNHINGIQHDNRAENLEWVTKSENCKHAYSKSLKRQKKSWNREEVIKLLKSMPNFFNNSIDKQIELRNQWIEENL